MKNKDESFSLLNELYNNHKKSITGEESKEAVLQKVATLCLSDEEVKTPNHLSNLVVNDG